MTKPPQKLGVKLMIDNATMRAIGHVAAQWAFLEVELDILLSQMLRQPKTKTIAPNSVPQSFDRRAQLLRRCAEALLPDNLEKQFKAIINAATSARGQRDRIVHGQWHLGRKKGKLGTAVTIINTRPTFKAEVRNMSADQVENVAANISMVTARLIWWRQMNLD